MDLSVIVCAYNMARELPRTLRSLEPPCQQGLDEIRYEILVLDNGSSPPLELPSRDGLIIHRIDPAPPSPLISINRAVAELASSDHLLICIDGARLLSPYVLRRSLDRLRREPSCFIYTTSRHLGPEPQMRSVPKGYNQKQEDALLAECGWEADLDRLFDVSVWAGAHSNGNYRYQNESNAFAIHRDEWDSLGGYDERFVRPGGGLANLEFFQRAVQRPGGVNYLLYGEATFHQVHGGSATSSHDYFHDSIDEYRSITGSEYRLPSYSSRLDAGEPFGRTEAVGQHFA